MIIYKVGEGRFPQGISIDRREDVAQIADVVGVGPQAAFLLSDVLDGVVKTNDKDSNTSAHEVEGNVETTVVGVTLQQRMAEKKVRKKGA